MKRYIFFALFLFLTGCDTDDSVVKENSDQITYQFYQNAQVNLSANGFAQIWDGANLVFKYQLVAEENPDIADDEFSEQILFEIPADLDEFLFSNEELSSINAYYDKFCFCITEGSIPLTNGIITGTKINATTWEVSIDVEFEDFKTVNKTVSGTFFQTNR